MSIESMRRRAEKLAERIEAEFVKKEFSRLQVVSIEK